MGSASPQTFRRDGLPDLTVKSFKDAMRALPHFDSNTALSRLNSRISKYNFPEFNGNVAALVAFTTLAKAVDSTNLESPRSDELAAMIANSSIALGISNLSNDPNGLHRCVDRSRARQVQHDALTYATFLLYADHVSEHLTTRGLAPLRRLQEYSGFVQAYVDDLLSQNTVDDMTDEIALHSGDVNWVEGSLFVLQYFNDPDRPSLVSADKIWDYSMGKVAAKWLDSASKDAKLGSVALAAAKGLPISYGINQDGYVRPPTSSEILEPLKSAPVQSDKAKMLQQIEATGGVQNWQSRAHEIAVLWEGQQYQFNDKIQGFVNNRWRYGGFGTMNPHQYDEGGGVAAMFGYWVQGVEIVNWLRNWRNEPYVVASPGSYWDNQFREPPSSGGASCFVAGTVIATPTGAKKIEDLEENDWILTRGDHDEWGLVSDEKVINSTESPMLFGFNGERPFFTAGHVFHTTTGLRAIDPTLAMTENPWANVGRLLTGHIVYRLAQEGGRYEQVPILHIETEVRPDVRQVYGIHLREGRRSYHANNYLVMVNYPEFTLKRICTTLAQFSVEDQTRMLRAIDELSPMFERFGIETISRMVRHEISTESKKASARMYRTMDNKLGGIDHASVAFEPEQIPNVEYSSLPSELPTVAVFERVVSVNGIVCEYAKIDGDSNTIEWSRSISGSDGRFFEHGLLKIEDTQYYASRGQLIYSKDLEGHEMFSTAPIQYLSYGAACDFEVTKQALSFTSQVSAFMSTQEMPAEEHQMFRVSDTEASTTEQANDVVTMNGTAASAAAAAAPEGFAAAEEAPQQEPAFDLAIPVMSFMETAPPPVGDLVYVTRPRQFDMVYDTAPFQEDQKQIQVQADFGPIQLSTQRLDNKQTGPGMLFSDVVIQNLDDLLNKWNESRSKDGEEKIQRLYDTSITNLEDKSGRVKAVVTLPPSLVEILLTLQDEKSAEDPSKKMTFKTNLNTDVYIPILFSRCEIIFSADTLMVESGTLWEYNTDSSRAGSDGVRHFFVSRPGVDANRVDARLGQGKVVGAIPTSNPINVPSDPQKPPPVKQTLGPGGLLLQDIQTIFAAFSDDAVKTRSDQIMQNLMFYHMDSDHKSVISVRDKTTIKLPDYLGTNLPSTLSDWIKGTFGPAYTCLQIAESLQTSEWKSKFTDKEKKKIIYFWQGQGPKCLAQSQEYAKLSKLCLREALLQLHSGLQKFVDAGGKKWAELYYEQLTQVKMDDIIEQCATNPKFLDRYQLILWCLDPDGEYPEEFRAAYYLHAYQHIATQRANAESMKEWMEYAIKKLVNDIYNDTADGAGSDLSKLLKKQMEDFVKEQGIALEKEGKDKLAAIVANTVHTNVVLSLATPGFKMIGIGIWRRSFESMKNQALLDQGLRNQGSFGKAAIFATVAKGLLIAGSATFAILKWQYLDESQKAKICGDLIRSTFDMVKPLIVRTEMKNIAEFTAESAMLNQKMRAKYGEAWKSEFKSSYKEYRKAMNRAGRQAEMQAAEAGFWGRLKRRFSISTKLARVLAIALSVVVLAFMIWDLVRSWSTLTTTGKALSIVAIVLEAAVVICAIIGLFSAVAIIPVIGQVCMVLALFISIALLIWGQPEREKTPGEKFVDAMQDPNTGWLSKIDDPPEPLLSYDITGLEAKKDSDYDLTIRIRNWTGHDVEIIPVADDQAKEPDTPSTNQVRSIKFTFTSGSDKNALFSNSKFSDSASESKTNDLGKVSYDGPSGIFKTTLSTPNGTIEGLTGYDYQLARPDVEKTTKLVISSGGVVTVTVSGRTGSGDKEFTLKVIESRPGAPCALSVVTIKKK